MAFPLATGDWQLLARLRAVPGVTHAGAAVTLPVGGDEFSTQDLVEGLGPGTSPILFENFLILQIDQEMGAGSAIVALDKTNGRELWRDGRRAGAGRHR